MVFSLKTSPVFLGRGPVSHLKGSLHIADDFDPVFL
jgi:hypothetical protein